MINKNIIYRLNSLNQSSGIQYPESGIRLPASGILHRLSLIRILIFILLFTAFSSAQTKYLIYLKDKGVAASQHLSKQNFEQAEQLLSKRSIERRIKNMGENYITYEDLPVKKEYVDILKSHGLKIKRKLKWFNAVSAYLTAEQLKQISYLNFIEKIEPVKILISKNKLDNSEANIKSGNSPLKSKTINQLNYGLSYSQLNLIDIPKVHSRGITGDNVVVGFLDSGFDWRDHECFSNTNIIAEYDFIFDDTVTANEWGDTSSQHNHGTAVFSTAGGFKDSMLIGGTYNSIFILAKTEDIRSETRIEEDNYAAALEWMDSIGVDITSSSLGYSEFDDPEDSYTYADMDGKTTVVTRAAELAFNRGVVTITAAGNERNTKWGYIMAPADGFNTIAVGAVTNTNLVASFSSFGPTWDGRIKPDVVAQGVSILSASASGFDSYSYQQGTSLATPLACSAASLLLSAHPHLLNTQVRNILLRTADNSREPDNDRGYGLISVSRAISFPNLELVNNQFKLHKLFIDNPDIDPSSLKIFYYTEPENLFERSMNFDGTMYFTFDFPVFADEQKIYFYFEFRDSSGETFREPSGETYQFFYGDLIVTSSSTAPIPPAAFYLEQNFPNPFPTPSNPSSTIIYYVPEEGFVTLKIFDILGNEVRTVVNEIQQRGRYSININSSNLASGVYIYQLRVGILSWNRKMVVLK